MPRMTFQRFGRSYHLRIRDAGDLKHVLELKDALWVAMGAPIVSINCEPAFLDYIDIDKNGRILCFEVRNAIEWLLRNHRNLTEIKDGNTVLNLESINADHDEGRAILGSAKRILGQLGCSESEQITLEQAREIKKKVEGTSISGAGVVLPDVADDPDTSEFIADIVATVGGTPHPDGRQGVDEKKLAEFLTQAKAVCDWHARGRVSGEESHSEIMPLGANTSSAFGVYIELRDKLDQYFAQCEAVAMDPRMAGHIQTSDDKLKAIDTEDPNAIHEFMKHAPLAAASRDRTLDFGGGANPYYRALLLRLKTEVVEAALGKATAVLSEEDWKAVKKCLAAHEAWVSGKSGSDVEKLGEEKLNRYLDRKYRKAVEELIAGSKASAVALDGVRRVEKLILLQAHILRLVNNFVSFPHLYNPGSRAVFEMGTLVMDGRNLNFAVKVTDRAHHSSLAKTSNIFVVYVEVVPRDAGQKFEIAVPVTSGTRGNLCVGKRGIFLDIDNNMYDARVVEIIENPISISEAMAAPFVRIGKLLTGRMEAITAAAEKKLDATASVALTQPEAAAAGQQAGGQSKGLMAGGLLMGGGVAIAAVGSSLAYIVEKLKDVAPAKIALGILIAILAVILPASLMALFKLRRRDLSAILEGVGWAINARMRLTLKQGRMFTQLGRLPRGARGVHTLRKRLLWVLALLAGLWILLAITNNDDKNGTGSTPPTVKEQQKK